MAALTQFDIAGKHAIVTGGAQGLSRGMAEGLLEAGCKVVIIDVQKEKVEKVCEEYRAKGLEAYSVIGNLADRGSTGRASHPIVATCGDLSIVECDHFCDLGEITPDEVEVPGMFVDMILV